jgi:hypothetical protein
VSSGNHPGSAGAPGGGENSSSRKKERLNRRLPQSGKEPVNSKRGQQKLTRLSPDLKKQNKTKQKKERKNEHPSKNHGMISNNLTHMSLESQKDESEREI